MALKRLAAVGLLFGAAAFVSAAAPFATGIERGAIRSTALERAVLAEVNRARTDPRGYAARLEALLPRFDGRLLHRDGDAVPIRTREGASAVREAIGVLRRTPSRHALRWSDGLAAAARDHVREQGPRGALGHDGGDGSTTEQRVDRHGRWSARLSENIMYGPATARDVVIGLIVDDGVADRGHRENALDPKVRVAGVACGPHARYGTMCVVLHAGGFVAQGGERARERHASGRTGGGR